MAYCALTDIYPLLASYGVLDETTTPTAAQGEALVESCATELEGILRAEGYVLPITDGSLLDFLAKANSYGAAALLLKARYVSATGAGGDGGATTFYEDRYNVFIKVIEGGSLSPTLPRAAGGFAHGFRDSNNIDLAHSELVERIDRETRF